MRELYFCFICLERTNVHNFACIRCGTGFIEEYDPVEHNINHNESLEVLYNIYRDLYNLDIITNTREILPINQGTARYIRDDIMLNFRNALENYRINVENNYLYSIRNVNDNEVFDSLSILSYDNNNNNNNNRYRNNNEAVIDNIIIGNNYVNNNNSIANDIRNYTSDHEHEVLLEYLSTQ